MTASTVYTTIYKRIMITELRTGISTGCTLYKHYKLSTDFGGALSEPVFQHYRSGYCFVA